MKTSVTESNHRTNFLLVGIFFLVWSINGFFIGGNILKMGLLMMGFIMICITSLTLPKNIKFIRFALISLLILIIYWLIALLKNQKTTDTTIIIFDVICYLLFISGYLIAANLKAFRPLSPWVILGISLLSIIGGVIFIKFQSQVVLDVGSSSRTVLDQSDESGINVIGIAYTNAIIFFILYCFLMYYESKKWINALIIVGLISTLFVILTTESRGAVLFISLILFLINMKKITSFRNLFKLIGLIVLAIIIFTITLNYFPTIQEKLEGTQNRFQSLMNSSDDITADESSYARTLMMKDFIDNIEDFIFLGREQYAPYPHNQFMEIIMRWGIFLGAPLMFIAIRSFFKAFAKLYKGGWSSPIANLLSFLFVFCFLQSLTSMSLEMNRMYWLGLGFLVATSSRK